MPDIYLNPYHILNFGIVPMGTAATHRTGLIDGREAMDWRQKSLATYHRDCNFVRQTFRVRNLSFIARVGSILSLLHLNCTLEVAGWPDGEGSFPDCVFHVFIDLLSSEESGPHRKTEKAVIYFDF
ncbi:hypothetical protein TNCV_4240981 [Trichonephila clavipes]|nr:hypothetical protein TNCV_4240981 [Trichonephila clavipes]